MLRIAILALTGFMFTATAFSQELYMPRDVKQAFKNGTRSLDGRPGKNYWQNTGRYDITVTALPPDRTIKGSEQITYINNSPNVLHNIVLKLILNIHRPGALRYQPVSDEYLTSGIHIDSLTINGQPQAIRETPITWQNVPLSQALPSHDSIRLNITWHYEISLESGREGMLDSTTYYLAYFYPRVAVYDDYNGWDRMHFTDAQEFYNDFNNYTVKVNVPKNFIVWGTGNLQNPDAVLQPNYAKRLSQSLSSDEIIHIAAPADLSSKNITRQNTVNTWIFAANDITDMTFALSDHYDWDASSVVVDDATHRRASVQAAYNDTAADFHHMVGFGKHALYWFSRNWPGVPYPFPKSTIVQGYADMEYPMMVNDNTTPDTIFSRFVAEHEIAHTYFPFYMGINETKYGFMDEGWATTLELLIGREDLGKEKAENFYKQFRVAQWAHDASSEEDLPIITPGNILNGAGLGNNEYGKASLGYLAVKDLLGDALFKKCLQEYMRRWHGKHPIPWDFFNSISNASGQDLNWFWNNWYFTNGYIDMAIKQVTRTGTNYTVEIANIGGFDAPVDVDLTYSDGSKESLHQTPAIWKPNQKLATIHIPAKKTIQSIRLNGGIFMDADESNNTWTSK